MKITSLTLYGTYYSDCTSRLRLALNLKSLPYTYLHPELVVQEVTQDPEQAPTTTTSSIRAIREELANNPNSTIPILVIEYKDREPTTGSPTAINTGEEETQPGTSTVLLKQSIAALEFIEDEAAAFTEYYNRSRGLHQSLANPRDQNQGQELEQELPPSILTSLLPVPASSRSLDRAAIRTLVSVIAMDIHPLTTVRTSTRIKEQFGIGHTSSTSSEKDEGQQRKIILDWDRYWIERGLKVYEEIACKTAGRYSVGDEISLADVCLVPALWTAERFGVLALDDIGSHRGESVEGESKENGSESDFGLLKMIWWNLKGVEAVKKSYWRCQVDTPEMYRMVAEEK
jgi:maleylacetoacetate isomerase